MGTYNSRPHSIRAVRIELPFTLTGKPQWFVDAYISGRLLMTQNDKYGSYMTLINARGEARGHVGEWLCLNSDDTLFILSDKAFRQDFKEDTICRFTSRIRNWLNGWKS